MDPICEFGQKRESIDTGRNQDRGDFWASRRQNFLDESTSSRTIVSHNKLVNPSRREEQHFHEILDLDSESVFADVLLWVREPSREVLAMNRSRPSARGRRAATVKLVNSTTRARVRTQPFISRETTERGPSGREAKVSRQRDQDQVVRKRPQP